MNKKLVAYIKGEVATLHANTRNAMIKRGWITSEGKVTNEGIVASGLPAKDTYWLQMGNNVQIGKYVLPKGLRLPLIWRSQEGNNRRKWYFTIALPIKDGEDIVELNLAYNPKHLVELRKLPIDIENKTVLY